MMKDLGSRLAGRVLLVLACGPLVSILTNAQNRGVYPLGMSATNAGITPAPGITYVNQPLIYSRDESKGPNGEVLGTGSNSVVMDMNIIAWVSKKQNHAGCEILNDGHSACGQELFH